MVSGDFKDEEIWVKMRDISESGFFRQCHELAFGVYVLEGFSESEFMIHKQAFIIVEYIIKDRVKHWLRKESAVSTM